MRFWCPDGLTGLGERGVRAARRVENMGRQGRGLEYDKVYYITLFRNRIAVAGPSFGGLTFPRIALPQSCRVCSGIAVE